MSPHPDRPHRGSALCHHPYPESRGSALHRRPNLERPRRGSALCRRRELFLMESSNFSHVSVTDLTRFCTEETNKFLKQVASDDCFCLELFRRAIVERNDDAWGSIYQQYAPLVLTWVTQHQSATPILGQEGSAPLVNAAFAKFSQALTPAKIENFVSLAAILKYLKMCVHSVVADEVRARQTRLLEDTLE